MEERKFITIVVSVSIIILVSIPFVWSYYCNKSYIDAGYSRVMLPGSSVSHWIKK